MCSDSQGESMSANHAYGLGGVDTDTDLELRTASQEDRTTTSKTDLSVSTANYLKETEYLKSCVEQLQSDKAKLKSELKQKERQIVELEKEREEERVAMGTAGATATQRIVELSKRNRELNAEIAAEKNRVKQLQKKLKESEMNTLQKESQRDSSQTSDSGYKDLCKRKRDTVPKPQEDEVSKIAHLEEQLQQSKMKMAEQRNQCQVLKQELKLAQRVITKEVGEGVNVSTLLSGASGWRGRAQQIITLQSKLAELGAQFRQGRHNGSTHVKRVASSEYYDHTVPAPMADARQKAALRKIESDKRKNLDETRSELESLKADYSKIQQQCSALKARNKTLTSHVKSMKEEITSLQGQKDKAKLMFRKSNYSNSDDFYVFQGVEKEKQLLSKENQILQTQLEGCLTELQTLKASMKENNSSPLPPVTLRGRRRGEIERKAASAGQPSGSLHTHSYGSDDSLMAQVSQIERERLLELTKCLQQRLDASTDKCNSLDIEMRTLRQQNARFEKIVGRGRVTNGCDESKRTSAQGKVEELEIQLAIQMDVNAVLKDTLQLTRQEKM